jgi:general stress protein YciG
MSRGIPQIVPPGTHQSVLPEAGAARNPQSPQDAGLTPDRPPVRTGGHDETAPKSPRGFANMDQRLVREIARKGGRAAHAAGTAHEFTSEEARIAGRKGGQASRLKRRKRAEEHRDLRPRGGN